MADHCIKITNASNDQPPTGALVALVDKQEAALLMLLGFAVFSVLLAVLYNVIRRYVFHDADNLDTTFDAGGNVSTSLTAVTIASQLLWPGDILQSATVAAKFGVSGAFWYSTAAAVNITLFPLLSFQFKTRAPGAKTYLQVIQARFGRVTHTVFCFYALLINLVILTAILVVGIDLIHNIVQQASAEFCVLVIATLCGCYSFVGGLGSTFYVCYFNAVIVFALLAVLIANIFYYENDNHPLLGEIGDIYRKVSCLQGPADNEEGSYLTFWSVRSVIWALTGLCLTASITFCDQASWQSRIAAKPVQGVWGFLLATFVWFAVPSTIGTTTGLTYLALSANDSSLALSAKDIDSGLVTAHVSQLVMGRAGAYLVLTMFTMLVMSTGSGEIMAVSSIIVYDVYQTYIKPFRRNLESSMCILCGMSKTSLGASTVYNSINSSPREAVHVSDVSTELCKCPNVAQCEPCLKDMTAQEEAKKSDPATIYSRRVQCPHHGAYRAYQASLVSFKNWCILWVTIALVPFGLLVHSAQLNLNWVMLVGSIATIPCFPGVLLSLAWVKATGRGLCVGSISGLVCGLAANLIYASTLEGGLGRFLENTSDSYPVLAGCCTAILTSLLLTVLVSLCTHDVKTKEDEEAVWRRVRQIDNPLHPWTQQYSQEFPELPADSQPTFTQLSAVFRSAKITAIAGSVLCIGLLVLLIPGVMASLHVLSEPQFRGWFTALQVWCGVMGVLVLVVTPAQELRAIWRRMAHNRRDKYAAAP